MTEKDAVKCGGAIDRRHWAVPVEALFSDADEHVLLETVFKCMRARRRESPATTVLRGSDVDG
jgi:tetraacyldisaccharide-1-P 4'-kinase